MSNRRLSEELRATTLAIVRAKYSDFGPTLAQEKLVEHHGLNLSVETLRKWMREDGLWKTRRERRKQVQQPRRRRPCLGELVQIDGSDHAWFEERGPRCTLLVYVDDATSRLQELRFASESTFDYFESTRRYLEQYGKPVAFYSDKLSVFHINAKDPKAGDEYTQFGRALSELNVDIICANTPAAKGRVERANLTLQDRLVKELRLRNISTVEAGNAFLPEFREDYNRRFARAPPTATRARIPRGDVHLAGGPVVDNKSLAGALAVIQRQQQERDQRALQERRLTRRERALFQQAMDDAWPDIADANAQPTPVVDALVGHALRAAVARTA